MFTTSVRASVLKTIGKEELLYWLKPKQFTCSPKVVMPDTASEKTHFGFKEINKEDKQEKVYEVFKNVAEKYDLMNDAMSFGIHRLWKDCFVSTLNPLPGMKFLDVAGGTGDIAFRIINAIDYHQRQKHSESQSNTNFTDTDPKLEGVNGKPLFKNPQADVVVCDINDAMLKVGERRAMDIGISDRLEWIQGDAQKLPFDDNTFDAYTIAYGIRNVTDVQLAINEAYRVLKKGGRFLCLEFSHVENPSIRWAYDQFSFQVSSFIL